MPFSPASSPGLLAGLGDRSIANHSVVDVELTGTLTRGMTVADWRGHWGRQPNALIGERVDPAVFFDRFIDRVGPFAQRLG